MPGMVAARQINDIPVEIVVSGQSVPWPPCYARRALETWRQEETKSHWRPYRIGAMTIPIKSMVIESSYLYVLHHYPLANWYITININNSHQQQLQRKHGWHRNWLWHFRWSAHIEMSVCVRVCINARHFGTGPVNQVSIDRILIRNNITFDTFGVFYDVSCHQIAQCVMHLARNHSQNAIPWRTKISFLATEWIHNNNTYKWLAHCFGTVSLSGCRVRFTIELTLDGLIIFLAGNFTGRILGRAFWPFCVQRPVSVDADAF